VTFAYFDTSVLVKRYVSERGSAQVISLFSRHEVLCSAITPVELMSALSRKKRERELSEATVATVLRRIQSEQVQWEFVEVSEPVLGRAQELVQGSVPVRTLDAIHIASLIIFESTAGMRIPFITAEGRQGDVARRLNLQLVWLG
jgi:predicted nucleic acid-binding protein